MKLKHLLKFLLEELDQNDPVMSRALKQYPSIEFARRYVDNNDRITIVQGNEVNDENGDHIGIYTSHSYQQPSINPNKPNGIWYAFGMEWFATIIHGEMNRENFLGSSPEIYKITNIEGANIKLLNKENIAEFNNNYKYINSDRIDWQKVAVNFDGIELEFDPESLRETYPWLRGWDIKSGCIWKNISNVGLERIVSVQILQAERERTEQRKQTEEMYSELEVWWNQLVDTKNYSAAVTEVTRLYSKYFPSGTKPRDSIYYRNFLEKIRKLLGENDPSKLEPNELSLKKEIAINVINRSILHTINDPDAQSVKIFGSWANRLTREGIYAWEDEQLRKRQEEERRAQ